MLTDIKKGVAVAINKAKVNNTPRFQELMYQVGPKVCITTAMHEGFLGFHAFIQVGAHPLGGRFGAAKVINADSLEAIQREGLTAIKYNPLELWQYTVWEKWEDHEEMHYQQFDRIFELCVGCFTEVVEGPNEPIYVVREANMPPVIDFTDVPKVLGESMMQAMQGKGGIPKVRLLTQRIAVVGIHKVKEGMEEKFIEGAVETLELLNKYSAGMIGWMILEKIGESPYGTFQIKPPEFWEVVASRGAVPPKTRETIWGEYGKPEFQLEPAGHPKEFIVHMEWSRPESAMFGPALTAVNPKIKKVHDEKVMTTLAHIPPYYKVFMPLMEDLILFP
ncbi:sulfur oxygenase reductase family protein [Aquifex aeolicus]|uniref:Sulfur oxygenase reductase n=1 Tax=Aquifex aeolicus (strain VF5) TaxID=224324 RepID=O66762_AQUAE|nr:sulfur oxygenase reductase family protein [Aquifex aeolicus]AAC06723.1 sulfur oxygenase reductase [Aquifex aeolicus VF5]